jgi:alkylation response protein AidB-like acyl-CoA dehydrogenase
MVPINEFGTEASAEVPAQAGHRRVDRLLRPDRAQPRLRPRQHGHPRPQGGRRLQALRAARCGSPTARSPTCSWSGPRTTAAPWARSAASCWKRAWKGLSAPAIHGKVGLRASDHRRDRDGRGVRARRKRLPRSAGLKGPFTCLNSARYGIAWGALGAAEFCWHTRPPVHAGPQAVRPPAGRQPADPEEAGRHADRDHAGPAGLPAPGPHEGRGHGRRRDHLLIKRNSCGKALDIARMARDMLGGNGISDEFGVAATW